MSRVYYGIATFDQLVHESKQQYIALQKHIWSLNINKESDYSFPVIISKGADKLGYNIPENTLAPGDYPAQVKSYPPKQNIAGRTQSFYYALADALVALYSNPDYRNEFVSHPPNPFSDTFRKIYSGGKVSRVDACMFLAIELSEYFENGSYISDLVNEFRVHVIVANIRGSRSGDTVEYVSSDILTHHRPRDPSDYGIAISTDGSGQYNRIDEIDGVHGAYLRNIMIMNILPETDKSIDDKIDELRAEPDKEKKNAKIHDIISDIGAKISSPLDNTSNSWMNLINGLPTGPKISGNVMGSMYIDVDCTSSHPGINEKIEFDDFAYKINTGIYASIPVEIIANDGVYHETKKESKWNVDRGTRHTQRTFYIALADSILDNIYSNPFYHLDAEEVPIAPGLDPTELLYSVITSKKRYLSNDLPLDITDGLSDDLRGQQLFKAARDQMAHNIWVEFGSEAADFTPGNIWSIGSAPTTSLGKWMISVKIFIVILRGDTIIIRDVNQYSSTASNRYQVVLLYDEISSMYFRVKSVDGYELNPLLFAGKGTIGGAGIAWVNNLRSDPDKNAYLASNPPLAAYFSWPSGTNAFTPPGKRDESSLDLATHGVYYMLGNDAYNMDQMDYDKIKNHVIKLNTYSKLDMVFSMWFEKINNQNAFPVSTFYISIAKGIHKLLNNPLYLSYVNYQKKFPGSEIVFSGIKHSALYDSASDIRTKYGTLSAAISRYIGDYPSKKEPDLNNEDVVKKIVAMLNLYKFRVSITEVMHSRSGVMYELPTTRKKGTAKHSSTPAEAAAFFDGGFKLHSVMEAPVEFSIVLARVSRGGGVEYYYVDEIDGQKDVLPTPYISQVTNIVMESSIKNIWKKTGKEKQDLCKRLYLDNKNSTDKFVRDSLKFYYKERSPYLCPRKLYQSSAYQSSSSYSEQDHIHALDYVRELNRNGRETVCKPYDFGNRPYRHFVHEAIADWIYHGLEDSNSNIIAIAKNIIPTKSAVDNWLSKTANAKETVYMNLANGVKAKIGADLRVKLIDNKIDFFDSTGKKIGGIYNKIVSNILPAKYGIEITSFRHSCKGTPVTCYTRPFYATEGYARKSRKKLHMSLVDKKLCILREFNGTRGNWLSLISPIGITVEGVDLRGINEIICEKHRQQKQQLIQSFFNSRKTNTIWTWTKIFYRAPTSSTTTLPIPTPPPPPKRVHSFITRVQVCDGRYNGYPDSHNYRLSTDEKNVVCKMAYYLLERYVGQ